MWKESGEKKMIAKKRKKRRKKKRKKEKNQENSCFIPLPFEQKPLRRP